MKLQLVIKARRWGKAHNNMEYITVINDRARLCNSSAECCTLYGSLKWCCGDTIKSGLLLPHIFIIKCLGVLKISDGKLMCPKGCFWECKTTMCFKYYFYQIKDFEICTRTTKHALIFSYKIFTDVLYEKKNISLPTKLS